MKTFADVRDATNSEGLILLNAVKKRDSKFVAEMICFVYSEVVWGKVSKQMTEEERQFVSEAIQAYNKN